MTASSFARSPLVAAIEDIRASRGWILALGILLMVVGVVCIAGAVTATFATVLAFGWLLLFSAGIALAHAFHARGWTGFFLWLLSALLRGFTGYLLIRYPSAGAAGLTLVLASFFIVGGAFRAIGSAMMKFPRWRWSVVSGLVSLVLGIMLLGQMPVSSIWFIGFAIGIDMLLDGASLVGLATAIDSLPALSSHRAG